MGVAYILWEYLQEFSAKDHQMNVGVGMVKKGDFSTFRLCMFG